MDSLENLEERVLLAVQTIRQLRDETTRLKEQASKRETDLGTALRQRDELKEKLDAVKNLGKENEILRSKHDEIKARVEQLISKLDAIEKEMAADGGQAELLADGAG